MSSCFTPIPNPAEKRFGFVAVPARTAKFSNGLISVPNLTSSGWRTSLKISKFNRMVGVGFTEKPVLKLCGNASLVFGQDVVDSDSSLGTPSLLGKRLVPEVQGLCRRSQTLRNPQFSLFDNGRQYRSRFSDYSSGCKPMRTFALYKCYCQIAAHLDLADDP